MLQSAWVNIVVEQLRKSIFSSFGGCLWTTVGSNLNHQVIASCSFVASCNFLGVNGEQGKAFQNSLNVHLHNAHTEFKRGFVY